jgi:hypothetical protein
MTEMNYMIASVVETTSSSFSAENPFRQLRVTQSITPIAFSRWWSDANRIAELLAKDFAVQPTGDKVAMVVFEIKTLKAVTTYEVATEPEVKESDSALGLAPDPFDGVPADTINWVDDGFKYTPPPPDLAADRF